jgi:hypothetical protein
MDATELLQDLIEMVSPVLDFLDKNKAQRIRKLSADGMMAIENEDNRSAIDVINRLIRIDLKNDLEAIKQGAM